MLAARSQSSLKKSLYILKHVLFMIEGSEAGEWKFYGCKGKINPADPFTKLLELTPWMAAKIYYMGGPPSVGSPFLPLVVT